MSETANGDGTIRVSLKQILSDIDRKLEEIGREVRQGFQTYDRRLGILEARTPLDDEMRARFVRLEGDFNGFERRVAIHESSIGHAGSLQRITALEATVAVMATGAEAQKQLREYIESSERRAADQRRWLVGLSISSGISLVAVVLTLIRLVWGGQL